MPRVLVIGATGTIGRELVSRLLALDVDVRALLRNPDTANLPAAIERVRGDLTVPETLDAALSSVDAVFLVWTAPPATAPAVIDRIAKTVSRLVFLTAPHQTPHPFFQQSNAMSAMLSAIEHHIESSSVRWTFIRPGMFAANCIDWWGSAFRNNEVIRWPLLQAPTAPIDPRDIADVAASVLTGAGHASENYVITGPESLTQLEQLQIIADTIDRPLRYEELTPDERRTFPSMLIDAWTWANPPTSPTPWPSSSVGRRTRSAPGPNTTRSPSFRRNWTRARSTALDSRCMATPKPSRSRRKRPLRADHSLQTKSRDRFDG